MSNEPNESSGEYVNTLFGRKPPRAQLPWILISAVAGVLVLVSAVVFRTNLKPLTFDDVGSGVLCAIAAFEMSPASSSGKSKPMVKTKFLWAAGYVLLTAGYAWRVYENPTLLTQALLCAVISLGIVASMQHKRAWQWWRRVRPWGWETVRDTGITSYQVHPSGKRRAVQQLGGYQPIDRGWVATGKWAHPDGYAAAVLGTECDHGLTFDADTARDMCTAKVQLKYPRLCGECPKGCGFSGIAYSSQEHRRAGDW